MSQRSSVNSNVCSWAAFQEQVLAEASMMVPDTRQRLETALADLQQCLVIIFHNSHSTVCCKSHLASASRVYVCHAESKQQSWG